MPDPRRRFPTPWHADKIPGGYVVRDANGQALAYLYGRANEAEALQAKTLTNDDPIQGRPGFAALLDRIEGNGVRTVIVEDASRFARELMTQELGLLALIKRGVRVVTASGDDLTDTSDPSRVSQESRDW
jgi:hypothetical protein